MSPIEHASIETNGSVAGARHERSLHRLHVDSGVVLLAAAAKINAMPVQANCISSAALSAAASAAVDTLTEPLVILPRA